MSNAPIKKLPWAIKRCDRLQLAHGPAYVLIRLADIVDGESLHRHATQKELARRTRMSPATIGKHVKTLVAEGCIRVERTREGYHYYLLREDAPAQSEQERPNWPWDERGALSLQEAQQPPAPVADQELQNLNIRTSTNSTSEIPGSAKTEHPDLQNLEVPLMKSPLEKERKEERTSLRSVARAQAPATPENAGSNVVVLSAKAEQAQAIEAWNLMAQRCDLPRVMRPGESAMRRLGAQIRRHGIEDVLRAIEAVGASPWCTGVNDSGWRADFYFLLQAQSFDRLLSGFYAAREGCARVRPGTHAAFQRKYGLGAMQPVFDPEPEGAERLAQ